MAVTALGCVADYIRSWSHALPRFRALRPGLLNPEPVTHRSSATVSNTDSEAGPLDRVAESLTSAAAVLRQRRDPEWKRCLALIDAAGVAATAAAARLAARRVPVDREALATWEHAMREPLTAVAGWAQMLRLQPATAARAVPAIERNAARLIEVLRRLPA